MIIIGQQVKKLEDLKPFAPDEIKAFVQGMEGYIKSETPLEIPVGISGNDLGRLTLTMKILFDFIEKVGHSEAGVETPGMDQIIERWTALQNEARDMVAPKPRLIIPK